MSKLSSRSFWLAAVIVIATAWFVHVDKVSGGQWVTLSTVVLGLWQVGDKAQMALGK